MVVRTCLVSLTLSSSPILFLSGTDSDNSDHWNALVISLRELSELVIEDESELELVRSIGHSSHLLVRIHLVITELCISPIIISFLQEPIGEQL